MRLLAIAILGAAPAAAQDAVLLLGGDTNLQSRARPGEAFAHVMPVLKSATVRFVNLEGPFSDPSTDPAHPDIEHKEGWRHSHKEMAAGLVAAGIDGVGVANNVTYPWRALLRSLSVLDAAGIPYTGGGRNLEAAHRPLILERNGVRFGFLQYTSIFWPRNHAATADTPGVATVKIATSYEPHRRSIEMPGAPPRVITTPDAAELERMVRDIRALRERADIVTTSFHWGISGSHEVADYQRTLARAAIDAGADIVIGHGPHQIQAVERWKGKPVFYSLGNFVFDWEKQKDARDGLLVRAVIRRGKLGEIVCLPLRRDASNNPVLLDPSTGEGRELWQLLERLSGPAVELRGNQIVVATGSATVRGRRKGVGR